MRRLRWQNCSSPLKRQAPNCSSTDAERAAAERLVYTWRGERWNKWDQNDRVVWFASWDVCQRGYVQAWDNVPNLVSDLV